jgi:NADH:ubiquinone oxidoreductase subunit
MGCDAMGNRYYENRVDYPMGQNRWVEPADIHNFDATHIPPEWHGWMTGQNDVTPYYEQEYIDKMMRHLKTSEISHAPFRSVFGHQEPYFNFHNMHNQSQIRSRGYGIGNHVVGLPPGAPDAYYTQPGSPYNEHSIRKIEMIGDLDEAKGGGRPYKSEMWKERLKTPEEKEEEKKRENEFHKQAFENAKQRRLTPRELAILQRGGSI